MERSMKTRSLISNIRIVFNLHCANLGPVYTGLDKYGTGPGLGPDRPCIDTGPSGTGTMWSTYPVQCGST